MFPRLTLPALAVAALAFPVSTVSAQCASPQGNAELDLSGYPQLGGQLTVRLAGRANRRFVIVASAENKPITLPFGTICVGTLWLPLTQGVLSGALTQTINIPNDAVLIGQTAYFQGVIDDDLAPQRVWAISNLAAAAENFSAANSRIEDADFAAETAIYVKNQILVQAGTAVLAQANILPQAALTLLS